MDDVLKLIGKDIEVIANGIIYRGRLIEVTETEVSLQTEGGWITIPMDKVNQIYHAS